MKFASFLIAMLLITVKSFTQTISKEQFEAVQKKLPFEKDLIKKVSLLNQAASYYVQNEDASEREVDSASLLNRESIKISNKLGL